MDFSREDRAPDDALNRVIWHAIKGAHTTYPVITDGGGRVAHRDAGQASPDHHAACPPTMPLAGSSKLSIARRAAMYRVLNLAYRQGPARRR
jgi:hypothetical protein